MGSEIGVTKEKKEKFEFIFLVCVLVVFAFGIECKEVRGSLPKNGQEENNPEHIVIMLPTMGQEPEDMKIVEDALNEICEQEINISVEILACTTSDYQQELLMKLNNGEQVDIASVAGLDMEKNKIRNQVMQLDNLLETYGKKLLENVPQLYMDASRYNGALYSVPVVQGVAQQPILLVRKDIALEAGYDLEMLNKVRTWQELEKLLNKVKEVRPDMIPFSPVITTVSMPCKTTVDGLFSNSSVDILNDCIGVLYKDNMNVENYWDTELFKLECETMHDWYEKGLIWKDGTTSPITAIDRYLFAGDLFCFSFSSIVNSEEAWEQPESILFENAPTVNIPIGDPYVESTSISESGVAIMGKCENPIAAVKVLDLLYSNEEVTNLLYYGIEGKHYTLDSDGLMLETEETYRYSNSFSNAIGNQLLSKNWQYNGKAYLQKEIRTTLQAEKSSALGFNIDWSDYSRQVTGVTEACRKYLGGLMLGALDPETELPKFLDALSQSGMSELLEEKQRQLDTYWKEDAHDYIK